MKRYALLALLFAQCVTAATYQIPQGKSLTTIPKLAPGDRVELQRGGVWREALPLGYSGSPGNPIVYASYGSGPKPVIDLGDALPGWSTPDNWRAEGGNVSSISFSYWPGRMWFDGVEYGCPGYTNATSSHSQDIGDNIITSRYRWWWNSGRLYVYAPSNPANYYSSIEIAESRPLISNSCSGKSYLTFMDLEFRRGCSTISLNDCDYITFDSCKILAGASTYGLRAINGSDDGIVQNHCTFDREDAVQYTFEYGGGPTKGDAQDNIALNCCSYWEIRDSYFGGCSHAGVNIDDGYNNGNSRYNKIHDCEFYGGADYDRAFLMNAIYSLDGCSYNEFYRNHVHDMTVVSQLGGKQNRVYCNVFSNQRQIPWETPNDSWRSTMIVFTDDHNQDSCYVLNNTFSDAEVAAVSISAGARHCFVQNNIINNPGTGRNPYDPYIGFVLWQNAQTNTIQNNIIYSPSSLTTCFVNQAEWMGGTATPRPVSYLNSFNGSNSNIISGNLAVNPQLGGDFSVSAGSPAIGAGVNVGLTLDYLQQSMKNPPDIGAIQSSTSGPPGPGIPAAPSLYGPSDNALLRTPDVNLVWVPAANAARHRVQVADDYFQTIKLDTVIDAGSTSIRFGPIIAADGMYYWRVAGLNSAGQGTWAKARSFTYVPDTTTPPAVLPVPVSIAPRAGLSVSPGSTKFVWGSSGSGSTYRWQLAQDSSFSSTIADTTLRDTSVVRTLASKAETLWWRAGVRQSDSTWSFGQKRSLFVSIGAPPIVPLPAPVTVYPASGLMVAPGPLRFVWHASGSGAAAYLMQLARDSSFIPVLADTAVSDTAITFALSSDAGIFWWRAGVRQADGQYSFGQKRTFTVLAPSPTGTLDVNPDSLPPGGGTVRVTWNSANAQTAVLDQGIGQVPLQGHQDVRITASTTFAFIISGNGETRTYSASVRVANSVPAIVLPLAPPSGALIRPSRVTLIWTRLAGVSSYQLQAATDSLFMTLLVNDTTLTDNVRVLSNLSEGVTVFWRVRAKNSNGVGAFSAAFRFSTVVSAVPAGSISTSPDNLPAGGGLVHLVWSAVNTDSVRIDPGLGTLPASGSLDVQVTSSRLFTLNAVGIVLARAEVSVVAGPPAATRDITSEGTPVASVASPLIATINDGTMLPPGSTDSLEAYRSLPGVQPGVAVWVGYEFPARRTFTGVIFQDGPISTDGGWFDTLSVQVRSGGTWKGVTKLQTAPAYDSACGPSFETYILRFTAASGDAIRILGTPGGTSRYITVGELRVLVPETPLVQDVPPHDYGVDPNYPNPFNPTTRITYRLPAETPVRLTVYNILGEEVARLVDGVMAAGVHTAEFSGRDLPAGVYFYLIRMGGFSSAGKMLLIR